MNSDCDNSDNLAIFDEIEQTIEYVMNFINTTKDEPYALPPHRIEKTLQSMSLCMEIEITKHQILDKKFDESSHEIILKIANMIDEALASINKNLQITPSMPSR